MRVATRAAALLVAATLPVLPVAVPTPAFAADDDCSGDFTEAHSADAISKPFEELNVERAQTISKGEGVGVAVIDSGVDKDSSSFVNLADEIILGGLNKGELRAAHGTEVAGLIAGGERDGKITGIAPEARILSVRVYDDNTAKGEESDEDVDLTAEGIAKGIDVAVDNADRYNIKVINVSLTTGSTEALKDAVKRAQANDILVVAATGNRTGDGDEEIEPYEPGENAKKFPASYDGVLGVNANTAAGETENDVAGYVLASRSTDVTAPTALAVTAYPEGGTCLLSEDQVATSWSTAMVSGLAAMIWEEFPKYTPEQTAARIMETANGSTDDRNVFTGFGVIRPVEALTRDLTISREGEVSGARPERKETGRASAPEPPADRYADARRSFVWWGLLAGGALVLAALLRPLFARQRR
ncbi:S8 family serine peptidase [Nocardioides speluncae]|uniref:S8 family serine peptidase n=1 Tax=Nocardioides speluncae TaxID=2670337 RepID=UPI0013795448|nr:S8 family serine peptidase [Nocardioides speluncae]